MSTFHQNKKKILVTINNNNLGGIEKYTILLSSYLNSEKYEIVVAMPVKGKLCEIYDKNNIKYFNYNNGKIGKISIKGFLSIFKNIYKNKYDIIHAQAGIAPCLAGKLLGTDLIIEHKHGLNATYNELENPKKIKLIFERIKKYLVDLTIVVCNTDKEYLIRKLNYDPKKVIVLFNGIENSTSNFENRKDGKFIIGNVGRLSYPKAQENFVEMAKILVERNYDFEFHIYGEGELRESLSKLIKKYNLEKKVLMFGFAEDINKVFNSIDLFVLTSRNEGIPYVLLEAMKNFVPIVTTDVGGIKEVISNLNNGLVIQKNNIDELVNNVLIMYNDPDLRKKLSLNARKDFENKFDIRDTIKELEKVYCIK